MPNLARNLDGFTGGGLLQTAYVELAADVTTVLTASPGDVLLTLPFTKQSADSLLLLWAQFSGWDDTLGHAVLAGLFIDAVMIGNGTGQASSNAGALGCASLLRRASGIASGARSIELGWWVTGGTGEIPAVSSPDRAGASLLVAEVLV